MPYLLRKFSNKDAWAEVENSPLWEQGDCPPEALVQFLTIALVCLRGVLAPKKRWSGLLLPKPLCAEQSGILPIASLMRMF